MAKKPKTVLSVEALKHDEAKRKNIPTAEYQSVMAKNEQSPVRVAYERRNRDLDPQLVWRGKDEQDWSDLVVHAPPLYIQEKVQPKALIDDLRKQSESKAQSQSGGMADMFADFNGLPEGADKTDFYQHEGHWQNRMILGDSLQVMASLAEREGLRGKVQCVYFDPPYGIKFNSNFQWSTTSTQVKDGSIDHITREPEQVKAFRDTWRDGIHTYLTYLRDRLMVMRDLLADSGSIFVQIGDENVHRVRSLLDEVFGDENFIAQICVHKTSGLQSGTSLPTVVDYILQYARNCEQVKFRPLYIDKRADTDSVSEYFFAEFPDYSTRSLSKGEKDGSLPLPDGARPFSLSDLTKPGPGRKYDFSYQGKTYNSGARWWGNPEESLLRVGRANRLLARTNDVRFRRFLDDFSVRPINNTWRDTAFSSRSEDKTYVVQTAAAVIERCLLMATDPGDLVLDPTCGSGTTAYVAEQWGRRWITLDTSRVALALARARVMGARYPYFILADSQDGQRKEAELTRSAPSMQPTRGNVRQGFVNQRVPHITLKSIANNTEIDVIWEKFQLVLEPVLAQINKDLGKKWREWEVPREVDPKWSEAIKMAHALWRQKCVARQTEIDASIAAKADAEFLYDKPFEDKKKVRVAGPFTVESLSPHRVLGVDENDELVDGVRDSAAGERDFVEIILANLREAGVQQAHKENKIDFVALAPWPGELICAEGRYMESDKEKRAAIFIGPEFGTVSRIDLVASAREAGDADFDVLIACAFNFDAHSSEFAKLGRIPVLKARMNADLHMAEDLKNTGKGNLFVIFGEPDIDILDGGPDGAKNQIRIKVNGVDVFKPQTGQVESSNADEIACWFIDTDYNEESFFVRHAYFLGANDPYKALKTTLKAEINPDAWATLNSDTSRPFDKPKSGRIAVKVINHLGDEVMKVFKV